MGAPSVISMILMLVVPYTSIQDNFWHVLAQVNYEKSKDNNGYEIEKPIFSKYLKSFQGKSITLKGYMIPLNENGGKEQFMLSSLPFNVCYFCGAAGPETVVEVESSQNIKFTTKQITMKGILILNDKFT